MAMGEEQDIPCRGERALDDLVRARPDLRRGLAARDAVAPQRPPGTVDPDVDGAKPLVVPVVPLEQVVSGLALVAEAGEATGVRSTREGAGEHEGKLPACEPAAREVGLRAAFVGQGDVGATGVTAELGPLGLTVTNENDLVGGHARSLPRARGRLLPMRMRRAF